MSSDPFNYLEDGSKEIKGGRRETKGRRGAESERTGYGKREVMIHPFETFLERISHWNILVKIRKKNALNDKQIE